MLPGGPSATERRPRCVNPPIPDGGPAQRRRQARLTGADGKHDQRRQQPMGGGQFFWTRLHGHLIDRQGHDRQGSFWRESAQERRRPLAPSPVPDHHVGI